jgi:AraC-like DNA-binding protein
MQETASAGPVYHESGAPAPLAAYVRLIWSLDLPAGGGVERIVPDGCCELVLTLEGQVLGGRHEGAMELRPDAIAVGQMSRPTVVQPLGRVRLIGVRLHPWAAAEFLHCDARELTGRVVELGLVAPRLQERFRHTRTAGAVRAALQAHVADRARPRSMTAAAVELIRREPTLSVRDLTRQLGWSERRLQRTFSSEVGIAPKTLARITRVQRAIRLGELRPAWTWARIAASSGFTDQAHLIREFRALAGVTPTALRAEPQPIRDRLLLRD